MTEKWKPISGYKGKYEISSLGRVKSLERRISTGKLVLEKILKQENHYRGYMVIQLRTEGRKRQKFFIHRLVATAFIKNPEDKLIVNHIDCNKKNNCVTNLEWLTEKENTQYYFKHKDNPAFYPPAKEVDISELIEYALEHF